MDQDILIKQVEALQTQVTALEEALKAHADVRSAERVARAPRPLWFHFTVAIACLVVSATAYAQLTSFTAGTPANASEVNDNFAQLKTWLEAKVGTVSSANVTVAGSATVAGPTTLNSSAALNGTTTIAGSTILANAYSAALSNFMINAPGPNYDVWVQGNSDSNAGGDGRNLALLGLAQGNGDKLIVNYANEYANGTEIQGKVDIGLERKVCNGIASGANCTCSAGKRLVGGGAYCLNDNEHLNTSYPASDTSWQAWCENSSGTNQTVNVTVFCARIL